MRIAIFQFSLFGINTYVLSDPETKECAVVDPGMINSEEEQAIVNFIESNGLKLKYIINTHLHIDHSAGIPFLQRKYGVPVLAHPADSDLGARIDQQAQMFGIGMNMENVTDFTPVHDGDEIKLGKESLRVIHVPGHSRGSIALYCKSCGFLVCGDILFEGSVGRTDLPGGSHTDLIRGIREKLLTLPGDTVVYPGHGPATTIAREKRTNPYLQG